MVIGCRSISTSVSLTTPQIFSHIVVTCQTVSVSPSHPASHLKGLEHLVSAVLGPVAVLDDVRVAGAVVPLSSGGWGGPVGTVEGPQVAGRLAWKAHSETIQNGPAELKARVRPPVAGRTSAG